MEINKKDLNKKITELYEDLVITNKSSLPRDQTVKKCYDIYNSYLTLCANNYKPTKVSQVYFLESATIESNITTQSPSDELLESIINAGLIVSDINKVLEILTSYMVQSVYYFIGSTEKLISKILYVIDNYNPNNSIALAYCQILTYYSSKRLEEKDEEIYKRFTNYIALDNSEETKAFYYLSLGYYKFSRGNFFESIYYMNKIISNETIKKDKRLYYRANHTLGISYAANSMLEQAIKFIDICLSEDSPLDKIQLRFTKARMLSQLKSYSEATAILEEIKSMSQAKETLQRVLIESFMVAVMNNHEEQATGFFAQLDKDMIARIPSLFLYSHYLSIGNLKDINLAEIESKMNEIIDQKREYYQEYLFFLIEYYSKLNNGAKILEYLRQYRNISSLISLNKKEREMNYYHELLASYEKISQEESIKKELSSESISQKIEKTIIGNSPELVRIKQECLNVANATFSNVLLTGETGTGKELLAQYIHYKSNRNNQNFCEFNLTAISPTLIESELFGYKKGAFTGADKDKLGLLNIVDKGTLFLDEISEISLDIQTKLLKVLEDKEFYPLGSTSPVKTDFRIISASNKDLLQLTRENKFRIDLFYRLCNYEIKLPALRERSDDIPSLAESFLSSYCQKLNIEMPIIDQEFEAKLLKYSFPGNIRELKNIMQRIAISLANKEDINIVLDNYLNLQNETTPCNKETFNLEEVTRNTIKDALIKTNGVQLQAAKLLGITANSIARKIAKYNLYEYCK